MTTNIQLFDFAPGLQLRSITKDSAPWFIAADICRALGHSNPSTAVASHVTDPADKSQMNCGLRGQSPIVVSEMGLYALILGSKKPAALAFKKWVTGTVLPTLRRDGLYIVGQEKPITDELTLPELMEQITTIQAKVDAINTAKVRAWSRHQEEKEARSDAFRFLKGKPARVRA